MSLANERLAKLEGQMEIFLKLLEEIREDVKDQISKDEIERLESQIKELKIDIEKLEDHYDGKLEKVEDKQHRMDVKLATSVANISILTTVLTSLIAKWVATIVVK